MPEAGTDPVLRGARDTARVAIVLLLVAGALRLWKLRRVHAMLRRLSPPPEGPGDGRGRARRLGALVTRTNRRVLPWEARCLTESLALWWLLRRRGIRAELRLGVRRILGPLESHAWVEHEGEPLNDTADVRRIFEPLDLALDGAGSGRRRS